MPDCPGGHALKGSKSGTGFANCRGPREFHAQPHKNFRPGAYKDATARKYLRSGADEFWMVKNRQRVTVIVFFSCTGAAGLKITVFAGLPGEGEANFSRNNIILPGKPDLPGREPGFPGHHARELKKKQILFIPVFRHGGLVTARLKSRADSPPCGCTEVTGVRCPSPVQRAAGLCPGGSGAKAPAPAGK